MSQKDINKLKPKNRPWMANYPKLYEWVHRDHARFLTQDAVGTSYMEKWLINGHAVLIEIRAYQDGWAIWTASGSNVLADIFADADQRIGR